jgi:cytoskeletal protein RodZ
LHSNEQTGNVMSVELDSSRDESHTIMSSLMVLLVILGLTTVLCSVLLVIAKRQEAMLDELLKRSGSMQETSVLINPETRSQGGSILPGSGR